MRIAICDDEQSAIDSLTGYFNDHPDIDIVTFTSFELLKEYCEKIDVAFLDMRFGDKSGFDSAQHILNINKDCIIAFFTNYSEYMKQSFEYRAFRYILKEEPPEFIKKQVDAALDEYYSLHDILTVSYKRGASYIAAGDILYIEMVDHTAEIHMTDGSTYYWYITMDNLMKNLRHGFVRVSRSFIVNQKMIKQIKNNKIFLPGGSEITIGRSYKNRRKELIK